MVEVSTQLPTEAEARESLLIGLLVHAAGGSLTIRPGSFREVKRRVLQQTEDVRTGAITFELVEHVEGPWEKFARFRAEHPDARIVSGNHFDGCWAELSDVVWHEEYCTLEMKYG